AHVAGDLAGAIAARGRGVVRRAGGHAGAAVGGIGGGLHLAAVDRIVVAVLVGGVARRDGALAGLAPRVGVGERARRPAGAAVGQLIEVRLAAVPHVGVAIRERSIAGDLAHAGEARGHAVDVG